MRTMLLNLHRDTVISCAMSVSYTYIIAVPREKIGLETLSAAVVLTVFLRAFGASLISKLSSAVD